MLEGREFTIFNDHKPLTHALFRTSPPWSAHQQRHLAYLAEFTSSVVHIPGKENVVADALSCPKPDTKPFHLSSPVQSHALPVLGLKVLEVSGTEVSDFSPCSISTSALVPAPGGEYSSKPVLHDLDASSLSKGVVASMTFFNISVNNGVSRFYFCMYTHLML